MAEKKSPAVGDGQGFIEAGFIDNNTINSNLLQIDINNPGSFPLEDLLKEREAIRQAVQQQKTNYKGFPIEYAMMEIAKAIKEKEAKSETEIFPLKRIGEIKIKAPEYLIDGIMEVSIFLQIIAKAGAGKTFLLLDMIFCIAAGIDWHGHKVKQGLVVYIAGEGFSGISRRVKALSTFYDVPIEPLPLIVSMRPAALTDIEFMTYVMEAIRKLPETPVLIAIDTLNANFGTGNENSTADMTLAVQSINKLKYEFGAAILLVHHTGLNDQNRGRGNSALYGSLDREYLLEKKDNTINMTCTKSKEAEPTSPMSFRLITVELEGVKDEKGKIVKSAVLVDAEYKEFRKQNTGKNQQAAFVVLEKLYQEYWKNLETAGRSKEEAHVKLSDWKEACKKEGISAKRMYEIIPALKNKNKIHTEGLHVYLSVPNYVPNRGVLHTPSEESERTKSEESEVSEESELEIF